MNTKKQTATQHLFTNKQLRTLLVPIMVEQLLSSLMGTADTMMVSNVGSAAISAVSLVDAINILVIQALSALAAGGAILCSQYLGSQNLKKAKRSAEQVLFVMLVLSCSLSLLCLIFRFPLLRLIFGTVDTDVMANSQIYFFFTLLSFPFIGLYDAGASILRAQNNTKGPMTISILSNFLNIGGNAILIFVFGMGVAGAAISTLVSRIFCAIVVIWQLRNPAEQIYVLENNGIPCVPVEIDESGLPIHALEQSGANLCYVTPSHHFPTGVTMPAPRRAQLLAWAAAKPGRFILEDDYDSEFRFATRPLPSLQGMSGANGPVVYLTTFSKSLAPGMRIACMVLPQGLLERYQSDFSMYANTVSRYEQQTLCEFMANGYFARHIARMRLTYKRRMEAFAAALHAGLDPDLTLAGAHSGLHFLLTLPGAGGEQAMVQAAAKQGVRLKGLSEYYMQDAAHCRPDTVVAGYSGLQAEDIPAAAAALSRAWRQMSHSII